jgi:hypothetical protein
MGRGPAPWRGLALAACILLLANLGTAASERPLLRLVRYQFAPTAAPIIVYEDAAPPDVLFMGSSRAAFGFDPAIAESEVEARTGARIRALNIAIVGGATDMNYLIVKNVLEDGKRPSLIVYGLAEFELMRVPGYKPCTFPYFALLLRWDDIAFCSNPDLNDRLSFLMEQLSPLYRDRELIRSALSIWLNPDDVFSRLYTSGSGRVTLRNDGFATWPPNYVVTDQIQAATRAGILAYLKQFQFDPERAARLEDFLALAHQRGIDVLLVNMPVPPEFLELWDSAESLNRFEAAVERIAQSHATPLVDLYANRAHGRVPAGDFIDLHHLSPAGAAIVTRLVADEYLTSRYQFAANTSSVANATR